MEGVNARTAIEALADNVLNARFEDIDRETVENTKKRILDVIGCAIGGASAPGNPALIKLVKDWGGKEEAVILAHGIRVPACNAAMVSSPKKML